MKCLEKIAAHVLFFFIFLALVLNVGLITGVRINKWELPLAYGLYLLGVTLLNLLRKQKITWQGATLAFVMPLFFLGAAQGLAAMYDTSWDGQDYHASAIIALSKGWNPWMTDLRPTPGGGETIVGYPKTTWFIQTSIYQFTGRLNSAAVTNVVMAFVAMAFVYGALRRLKIARGWAIPIALLAVFQIHFLQQAPTLMADGYSYQVALIAIAALVSLLLEVDKRLHMAVFFSAWLLLTGSKFNNLPTCGILGLIMGGYYLLKLHKSGKPQLRVQLVAFVAGAFLLLWIPFGRNMWVHHSPFYPVDPQGEENLKFENIPSNLRGMNRLGLLFFGIFSRPQPPGVGHPTSHRNVAALKTPFTFEMYEVGAVNDLQGRVGSGGILFSGLVLFAAALYGALVFAGAQNQEGRRLVIGIAVMGVLIVGAALIVPVPNKLRYIPLLTLIPLLAVVSCVAEGQKVESFRVAAAVLLALIAINAGVAGIALAQARVREMRDINEQFAALLSTDATYQVNARFYSSYMRLQEHNIPFVIAEELTCESPQSLAFTYNSARLCRQ